MLPQTYFLREMYMGKREGIQSACAKPRYNPKIQRVCDSVNRDGMLDDIMPRVVHETADFWYLYKPPHWVCRVGAGEADNVQLPHLQKQLLLSAYIFHNMESEISKDTMFQYGMCNRLDDETSGIVVVARNATAWHRMRRAIIDGHSVTKEYIALVHGHVTPATRSVRAPIACKRDGNRLMCEACPPAHSTPGPCKDGDPRRRAHTEHEVIRRYKDYKGGCYTLLKIRIYTGITHQI